MNHKIEMGLKSEFWSRFEVRIVVLSLLVHLPLIIYDGLYNSDVPDGYHCPDYDLWIDRTEVILDGGVLYRDGSYPVRAMPLASYFLLPPVIFGGGHIAAFELYFSLFDTLAAILIYRIFLRGIGFFKGEVFAQRCAIFYALNPFVIANSTLRAQDECILVVFFLLFTYSIILNQHYKAAVILGLGVLIKPTIGLLLPLLIFAEGNKYQKLVRFGIISLVVGAIILPFYILAGSEIIEMIENVTFTGGIGIVYFLKAYGYDLPLAPFSILFIVSYFSICYLVITRKIEPWAASLIIMCCFLLIFTKVHSSYFLFALVYAAPFALDNRKLLIELSVIFPPILTFIDFAKASKRRGDLFFLFSGVLAWIIVALILLHLAFFTWKTVKSKQNMT